MANLILSVTKPVQNQVNIQLGVKRNTPRTDPKLPPLVVPPIIHSETVTIINQDMPIQNFGLPPVLPPCDWADITLTVIGLTNPGSRVVPTMPPMIPQPSAAAPFVFPYILPPPAAPIPCTLMPWPAATAPVPGVIVIPGLLTVGLPPAPIPTGVPGMLDFLSMPGSQYQLMFTIMVRPGVTGTKSWRFKLSGAGVDATIAVCGAFLPGNAMDSE